MDWRPPLKAQRFPGLDRDVWLPTDITVIIDIVPLSVRNVRPGTKSPDKYHTVYHETGNTSPGANAISERNYLHYGAGGRSVGYNFAVDDQRIVCLIPLDEVTWHAGLPWWNAHSLGVEQCVGAGLDLAKARTNAAVLHGALCAAYGWDVDTAFVQHNAVYGKNCPAIIREHGLWPGVVAEAKAARLAAIATSKGTSPVPTTTPTASIGPLIPYPGAMDLRLAKRLFSETVGDDGKRYQFDESGPVSNLWLSYATITGVAPALVDVAVYGEGRFFIFSDGSVISAPVGGTVAYAFQPAGIA